jgi:hypothetical protein
VQRYQSICGALLYAATHTRPDIAYAVVVLCRAMAQPTPALYDACLRVIHYLHHHRLVGLYYERSQAPVSGMADSDWATRHSTSGYVFWHCSAAISWLSKKQATVALSSCEAEIVAASEATKEALYLSRFLAELGFSADDPVALATDSRSAQDVAYNPEHMSRMKHVERRHFFVREKIESLEITVPFVRSADNCADLFTKPLSAKQFFTLRDRIMNVCHASSLLAASASALKHEGDYV